MQRDTTGLVWFRRDLRLRDNPAWAEATRNHNRVLAVYVVDAALMDRAGPHRRRAIQEAIDGLAAALDGGLQVVHGDPATEITDLVSGIGIEDLYVNSDVTPYATARDQATGAALAELIDVSCTVHATWGSLIRPPHSILTDAGTVPKVFTAFWKRWQRERLPAEAEAIPTVVATFDRDIPFDPAVHVTEPELQAVARLEEFVGQRLDRYLDDRDLPAIVGTSRLSVDLKVGTLGPATAARRAAASPAGDGFVRQLAWRDWFAHLLAEEPRMVVSPLRIDRSPAWRNDPDEISAWKTGQTGFPIVDAGMRELLATGIMHNRVRMIAASFFVKDLLGDWRIGERYFRHFLADGDVAQNVGNWQWVAGTGPDAAPFFRVFNPTLQSNKFDPSGAYLRRWLPELAALDNRAIHEPATLGPLELAAAGITLGVDYPHPIVDHAEARRRAIAAYERTKR